MNVARFVVGDNVWGEMNALNMKLVIQKTLYESDMNTNRTS